MNSLRSIGFLGVLLCLCAVFMTRGTESRIEYKALPPALILTFTDLPPRWTVETTTDLTNWYSIVHSGDIPPKQLDFVLTNTAQAQFYRVVSTN